ncbi:MAG: D-aminoacyl-tRNA deacylase [Bacteroidaceae bacterium]|nr:D-aminoacyl-tRNA deacylase [Bacteroidaceae bacterium]
MRIVLQRVSRAKVSYVGGECLISREIDGGYVVLVGCCENDTEEDIEWLVGKIVNLRVMDDESGVMNKSILDTGGDIMVVSQFTLWASYKKGNRPSYLRAGRHEVTKPLYEQFCRRLSTQLGRDVKTGEFGADMKVELVNDGPVTICMDTKNKE